MKFGVIIFPGSNCDYDCFNAVKRVLKQNVEFIWHKDKKLDHYDCVIIPGGFSYWDYLRAGAIARFANVMEDVIKYAESERGLVIGICNGFQILTEAGLLPGALQRNRHIKFICRNTYLRCENNKTPFTNKFRKGQVAMMPIAHGEGNYTADPATIKELERNKQVIFRYCDEKGRVTDEANPNGSIGNIAGICSKKRNVLGMMPHPERVSELILGGIDGKSIFESILRQKS